MNGLINGSSSISQRVKVNDISRIRIYRFSSSVYLGERSKEIVRIIFNLPPKIDVFVEGNRIERFYKSILSVYNKNLLYFDLDGIFIYIDLCSVDSYCRKRKRFGKSTLLRAKSIFLSSSRFVLFGKLCNSMNVVDNTILRELKYRNPRLLCLVLSIYQR